MSASLSASAENLIAATTAAIAALRKAHARLYVPGVWAKGKAAFATDCDCLVTAIPPARIIGSEVLDLTLELLREAIGCTGFLWKWNDQLHRTLTEVLEAIDKAIAIGMKRLEQYRSGKTIGRVR